MSPTLLRTRGREDLAPRIEALTRALDLAEGRLDEVLVGQARSVVGRAHGRLALGANHTVVALAGATGSGKSSTFNALAGAELSTAGVRRPTTSITTAAVWGEDVAPDLLGWLEVGRRHHLPATPDLDGLVLLDLPDHDSTEAAHRLEVDRLVGLVDLLVWVVDPQKYADAALHERYLRPLATHRDVTVVVLNQIDTVADPSPLLGDLTRRLDEDGLAGVPVLAVSARTGAGIPELRRVVASQVQEKRAAVRRWAADLGAAADALAAQSGDGDPAGVDRSARADLVEALGDAAGVPTVVNAVRRSTAQRGNRQTGWLVTAWLSKLKPDPLRRLHLDRARSEELSSLTGPSLARTSLPEATPVQRARVDAAVRSLAERATTGLSPAWSAAVRRASVSGVDDVADALDRAVASTDLGVSRTPWWWRLSRLLQVVFALALVAGAGWLLVLLGLDYLQLPEPAVPERFGLPAPTLLLACGVGGGIALGILGRFVNGAIARLRARTARRRLHAAVEQVGETVVIAPVQAELERYREVRSLLRTARG